MFKIVHYELCKHVSFSILKESRQLCFFIVEDIALLPLHKGKVDSSKSETRTAIVDKPAISKTGTALFDFVAEHETELSLKVLTSL